MRRSKTKTSKFLSLVLRHKPELIGLSLDNFGWADIDELIVKALKAGRSLTLMTILDVVATSDKQRFAMSSDGKRIRAQHGHSIPVELALPESEPPEILYHGTAIQNLLGIRQHGILKGKRNFVHLSVDKITATKVGSRHGNPVVVVVQAGRMYRDGHRFIRSENGVWLISSVLPKYIELTD